MCIAVDAVRQLFRVFACGLFSLSPVLVVLVVVAAIGDSVHFS